MNTNPLLFVNECLPSSCSLPNYTSAKTGICVAGEDGKVRRFIERTIFIYYHYSCIDMMYPVI